jgi:hypothetical protein
MNALPMLARFEPLQPNLRQDGLQTGYEAMTHCGEVCKVTREKERVDMT